MRLARSGAKSVALRTVPAFLLAAVISGCHVPGTGASGTEQVTVAEVPGIDNAPLSVAVQDELFQQHGLRVTVKDYTSLKAELQAVTSGQAQVAAGDYTDFLYAQSVTGSGHVSLRLIADGYDATSDSVAILALPNTITTPQQLAGLKGGVATPPADVIPFSSTAPYNVETLAAEQVLQNDGVSPSSVTWKPMPPTEMIGALHSGQVKAILVSEPYILEAEEKLGAVEVMDASSGVTSGLPMSGYFSLASYAQAHSSAVQSFQAALSQAQSDCAQRGLVQSVLSGQGSMTKGSASLVTLGTYPASLNVGQVQRVATLMYDSGLTASPVAVNSLAIGAGS
jgi:NitT/TauT family transport system substrate-binding protein